MLARISATENSPYKEIATNEDGSIGIAALAKHFPNCVGLRYRCKSSRNLRATRVISDQLHLPIGVSWQDQVFHCVYEDSTRFANDQPPGESECCLIERLQLETFDMMALGLPDSITDDSFYEYFSRFGKLKLCELKKNFRKAKSKGYGFLRYVNFVDQNDCIRTEHVIGGATVSLRLPTAKIDNSMSRKKLFISNITPSVTVDDILEYFSIFGKITQIFMPLVVSPYAFLTYESEDSISRVFRFGESHRVFGGYVVVEKVFTKQEMQEIHSESRAKVQQDSGPYSENDNDNYSLQHGHPNDRYYPELQDQRLEDQQYQYEDEGQSYQYEERQYRYEEQQYRDEQQYEEEQYREQQYRDEQYREQQYEEEQHQYQYHYGPQMSYDDHQQPFSSLANLQNQAPYSNQNNNYSLDSERVDPYSSPMSHYPAAQNQSYPGPHFQDPSISANGTGLAALHHYRGQNPETNAINDFSTDIISGVVSRILEQASAPNEKDILVQLLVDQLISQKQKIEVPSQPEVEVNGQDKLVKAIQLLQNPTVLDSLLRLAENIDSGNGAQYSVRPAGHGGRFA